MRQFIFAIATVVAVSGPLAHPAVAAGCVYPPIRVEGPVRWQIQSARYASMAAWEKKAARVRGRRYANWDLAGDQTVECKWNARGSRIRCRATAAACTY